MSDCDLDVQATMTMKKVIDENEASDLCFRLVHLFITKSQMPQSKPTRQWMSCLQWLDLLWSEQPHLEFGYHLYVIRPLFDAFTAIALLAATSVIFDKNYFLSWLWVRVLTCFGDVIIFFNQQPTWWLLSLALLCGSLLLFGWLLHCLSAEERSVAW